MMGANRDDLTRRGFLLAGMALAVSGCSRVVGQEPLSATAPVGQEPLSATAPVGYVVEPQYERQRVLFESDEKPGSIIVDRSQRFLYLIEQDGWATRYGVGVGREGLSLTGRATIGRKAEWPSWTPTANMMRREPRFLEYANGVPGGPDNPLGARALYLYRRGRDTMFRIHGTNEPWSIGQATSSGCIRLTNDDIVDLYERSAVGGTVLIL
jgi:lipoprotein-anchoring transpeptidase ErfK/SrfK